MMVFIENWGCVDFTNTVFQFCAEGTSAPVCRCKVQRLGWTLYPKSFKGVRGRVETKPGAV